MVEVNNEGKNLLWSEHPQTAYTCDYNGHTLGIGAHPAIMNQGIWNLVWLLTPAEVMNKFLMKTDPSELLMNTSEIPLVVGTAWQMITNKDLVATAALKLTPVEFLELVMTGGMYKDLILTKSNPLWVRECEEKASTYAGRRGANIVSINFNKRG